MVLLKDIEFVCLDCETTGLDVKKDRVIEFAAIRFTFDEVIDSVEFLIHPEEPFRQNHKKFIRFPMPC